MMPPPKRLEVDEGVEKEADVDEALSPSLLKFSQKKRTHEKWSKISFGPEQYKKLQYIAQ